MRAGLYEARSLDNGLVAFVLLDDASDLRLKLHKARSALRILRWHVRGRMASTAIAWALSDVEEG